MKKSLSHFIMILILQVSNSVASEQKFRESIVLYHDPCSFSLSFCATSCRLWLVQSYIIRVYVDNQELFEKVIRESSVLGEVEGHIFLQTLPGNGLVY